ncbi:hypothetical protein ACT4R9_02240 [Ornithobacterium rhinotracheale]|uniref:hypothetical protein n=1 Tax=Ornithobacterium rhinotracheale TaxID=28251 RepID=UPI001FF36168|nr:hypothetical protein [Ornithobacterium rhinotracheale]MCK0206247.1 hypothetical protein [Ornithobacterium rhinotracheale]
MKRYLFFAAFRIIFFSILGSLFLAYIVFLFSARSNEHRHSCDMSGIIIGMYLMVALLGSISSSIFIFLNLIKNVRENKWYNILSFSAYLFFVFLILIEPDASEFLILVPSLLPLCLISVYEYFRFKKKYLIKN